MELRRAIEQKHRFAREAERSAVAVALAEQHMRRLLAAERPTEARVAREVRDRWHRRLGRSQRAADAARERLRSML